ncbi:MAG: M20/M25/M40 family metallo-hydrolase [Candidatus Eisenbacteria bacterium]|nr:M20/M25/M40 family metallo-hydrolase [Candidatus Eisenbacteria bacterium]
MTAPARWVSALALLAAFASAAGAGEARVRHGLKIALDPARGWLSVTDTLTVPASQVKDGEAQFLLNAALELRGSEPTVTEVPLHAPGARAGQDAGRFPGLDATAADRDSTVRLRRWRVALPASGGQVVLRYDGRFDFALSDEREQYTRGFRQTAGIVSKDGLYLAGEGFWYPRLGPGLIEFTLEAAEPGGWHVISPGNGTSRDDAGVARWDSHGPVDEITVCGGPLLVYRASAGAAEALVYLRRKDDALAAKYLEATAQYLEMYRGLIGPYPYGKFALVENFWETGYGMPSFTLLGSQVIRFPFILTSSYPHEILHNWWGNSVFVDYGGGNWCEGLTAYMADHLIQEQRGQGEAYRRDVLQKYRDYVREGRDFPLSRFRSRHSAATEAVGYGRALMLFHMVRRRIGDDAFRRWAAAFYRDFRGRQASFADVRASLEAVSGQDLGRLFAEQLNRTGAPELRLSVSGSGPSGGGYELRGSVEQAQAGEAFQLDVPVVVRTVAGPVLDTVRTGGARTPFSVRTVARPLSVEVDPSFDLFRLLDPRETPASIGQILGEPRVLAVLPARAGESERKAYRALVESWRSDVHAPEFTTDAELRMLPADRPVWLLGRGNALAPKLFASGRDFTLGPDRLAVDRESMPLAGHCAVLVRRHPADPAKAIGWIFADDLAALPGLGRKLPHYGKYSYLGFEGAEPANVLKGQWATADSPLRVELGPQTGPAGALAAFATATQTLPPRRALAELPPVFSQQALMEHVRWLASPEREGRGVGTKGLDAAAEYIATEFRKAGLEPGGDGGGYFQEFPSTRSPSGVPVRLRNVIGVLRGSEAAWAGQSALLTAHYDHLGFGWPDVHRGDEGRLHPGADDNASGVAVLLELAKSLAAGERPGRTLVFVAFTGEESGLQGSRYYAAHPAFPLDKMLGVINLDTVGRLDGKKLSVIAAGTASEWQHIFRGAGFVTGVEPRLIPEALESSDQQSFIERGVPAVQVFTDAHEDYHGPGDTADKVDGPGLVRVATFVREAIQYLGDRAEPLTNTIESARPGPPANGAPAADATASGAQGRRVTIGTMPDFAFAGPGVKVAAVTQGSPAEKAGLKEGDILVRLDGREISDLRGYSAMLKALAPGQAVRLVIRRDGAEREVPLTVAGR